MQNESINNQILNIWKKYPQEFRVNRIPILFNTFKPGSVLCIGSNPSFNSRGFKKILKNTPHEKLDWEKFYKWKNEERKKNIDSYTDKLLDIERRAIDEHPYFAKFRKIAEEFRLPLEHIDLFFCRETNQGEVKKHLYPNKKLTLFAEEQLELSLEMIETAKPKIILVANAFASEIIRKKKKIMVDDEKGCDFIIFKDQKIPIFFSSMLTGQRALDNESFERLKWHMKKVMRSK